jgi:hypothetical protein
MKKNTVSMLFYSILTITSLLIAMLGYVYTHKQFTPENLVGLSIAAWQTMVAIFVISVAGGIGNRILQTVNYPHRLTRMGFELALGISVLSILTLVVGLTFGTGLHIIALFLGLTVFFVHKSIVKWFGHFLHLKSTFTGKYETAVVLMAMLIFLMHFASALAPPVMFDTLVYHFSLPQAYLQMGQIGYLPGNIFWGMPQSTEMIYLLAMRFAGIESAALITLLIGLIAVLGIVGYIAERLGKLAAWTAVAALLAGETITISLSSGYVEWTVILIGGATLASLDYWLETRDSKLLILCGMLCGAAVSTKYTAGVIFLGCLAVVLFLPDDAKWKQRLSNALLFGGCVFLISLPWWVKNYFFTGNFFYPFFFPSGAMNEFRLYHYQNGLAWGNWRSVILLPWQATIWGVNAKEGFSASIGAILVGLSPLAWIGWKYRTDQQKTSIRMSALITLIGFVVWAVGSRVSGLLIQSRLFFGIFPAWALLSGVGMDAIWKLRVARIRFGRVAGALILLMFGFNLFATFTEFISRNPLNYVIRQEDKQVYLSRLLGAYVNAMDVLHKLPSNSHIIMLWEARELDCWPKCNADEVIDHWYDAVHTYQTSERILSAWLEEGYTHLMLNQAGADYIRNHESKLTSQDWQELDRLLGRLPPPTIFGHYALYSLSTR